MLANLTFTYPLIHHHPFSFRHLIYCELEDAFTPINENHNIVTLGTNRGGI